MNTADHPQTVAVIGLGAMGLVATKNLVEAGFDVTGFERNNYVGGLWHYTDRDQTSVLSTTIINISKERGCFTDFPFPDDTPSHCSAADVQRYLEAYVEHFGLASRLRLGTAVTGVRRDDANDRWIVEVEGQGPRYFDKVVMAGGVNSQPHIPQIEGIESFGGEALHSRAFKKPGLFKGKRVLIVGMGNSGADTAAALVGHADKIWISHRQGALVMPRAVGGVPVDHNLTARKVAIMDFLESRIPQLAEYLLNSLVRKLQDAAFNIRPEWHLSPPPPLKHAAPIISDNLIDFLTSGTVLSVSGIRRVSGPGAVELDDGTCLEADVIIWCTGYKSDFGSLLEPSVDPSRRPPPRWEAAPGSRGKPLPRLYRNVFSLDHPRSLAFMGAVAYATGSFPLGDVASMALAQVWRGASPLPSAEEMERQADAQMDFVCGIAEEGGVVPGWVRQAEWFAWADEAAGARVGEHLGWGLEGWKFWLRDRRFCGLLMDGIYTPYVWRLFEGKRKRWEGAKVEIEKLNTRAGRKKTD